MPVPRVLIRTRPPALRAAPNWSSPSPAASASLTTVTGRPSLLLSRLRASVPIQAGSMLAAVRTTPLVTTAGSVTPMGESPGVVGEVLCDLHDDVDHRFG